MEISLSIFLASTDQLVKTAEQAKADGFRTLWIPQIFGPDTLTSIAVAGSKVSDVNFATAVVPTYPRHPQMLAQQALTVNDAIDGRLTLGIGPSHQPVIEGMWGISFDKPVRHVREYLEILVPLLNDKRVSFAGEALTTHATLDVDGPAPRVMIAALGPQMLKVAGRLCDGTILWMTGPKTIAEHTAPTINAAAEAAGRPKPEIAAAFPVCVTDGSDAANEAAHAQASEEFAIYGQLPSYRAMLDREGYAGPADLALIGSADEVQTRIAALDDAGLTAFAGAAFGSSEQREATRSLMKSLL